MLTKRALRHPHRYGGEHVLKWYMLVTSNNSLENCQSFPPKLLLYHACVNEEGIRMLYMMESRIILDLLLKVLMS